MLKKYVVLSVLFPFW